MKAYTPREGSVADRAHMELAARGERSGAALADAIDREASGLPACLTVALEHGFIRRVKRDGLYWYSVGDGVPLRKAEPADDDDEDDGRPVQRVVPARTAQPVVLPPVAPIAPKPARKAAKGTFPVVPLKPLEVPTFVKRESAPAKLRVAQWSDGAVQVFRGGELLLDLDAADGGVLEAYFAR